MPRTHDEKLPGLALGTGFEDYPNPNPNPNPNANPNPNPTGFEDYFDSTFGFSIIGPDPRDPTQGTFSNQIQRVCGRNHTVNPVGQYKGVCSSEGVLFQHSNAGILHFSSDTSDSFVINPLLHNSSSGVLRGVERLSAYRFMDREVISFEDGGTLQWRNSDF